MLEDTTNSGQVLQLFAVSGQAVIRTGGEDDVQQVWRHYQAWHPRRLLLDPGRRKKILERLADGYTPAELCEAIDGCHRDPWYQGANDRGTRFLELTMILRDAAHVDRFRDLAEHPRSPINPSGRDIARATGWSHIPALASIAEQASR